MKKALIVEILSSLLILLFVYAALSKLFDYENFKLQLGKSPFINGFEGVVAWGIPAIEILTGLLLMVKRTRLVGLYISLFLMTMFSAYIYAMLHFSYYIPCSCGGILSKMTWSQHLLFNILFVGFSVAGILLQTGKKEATQRERNLIEDPIFT